ncbi:MAG: ZIP family metal transporter [Planctomycetes bacterium]|nr:ZIP family metal transporter [Planctomycetota bacterium]
MEVIAFKAIALVSILVIGLVGGFLSVWLASSKKSDRLFSLGNAFAGGIFLGAGMIHMLPDAQNGFEGFAGKTGFPWVFLICAIGFLIVLFLEKVLLHAHDAIAQSEKHNPGRVFYPYALTLVLSVHSIIAGIALGTEQTMGLVLVIMIAVAVHKGSAAFALGVSLFRGGIPKARLLKIICFFCFMTPLGIVIGSAMTALMTGDAELLATSVFDALAAGTFLYVALIDIVEHEFARPEDRRLKFTLVSSGLGMMVVLAVWL